MLVTGVPFQNESDQMHGIYSRKLVCGRELVYIYIYIYQLYSKLYCIYSKLALYLPYVQGLFTMTMKTSPLVPVAAYNSYDMTYV